MRNFFTSYTCNANLHIWRVTLCLAIVIFAWGRTTRWEAVTEETLHFALFFAWFFKYFLHLLKFIIRFKIVPIHSLVLFGLILNPRRQKHSYDPMVLLHAWAQSFALEHSSISVTKTLIIKAYFFSSTIFI